MALPSTMLRFTIELSDVDRGIYQRLELRVPRHPSESAPYLLTRLMAYALNVQEGLAFTGGIASPDDPALWVKDLTGSLVLWIDVGNPSAKRLHKATKAAKAVRVYTYREPKILLDEIASEKVFGAEKIEVFALPPKFLTAVEATLARDNAWNLLCSSGEISLSVGDQAFQAELLRFVPELKS